MFLCLIHLESPATKIGALPTPQPDLRNRGGRPGCWTPAATLTALGCCGLEGAPHGFSPRPPNSHRRVGLWAAIAQNPEPVLHPMPMRATKDQCVSIILMQSCLTSRSNQLVWTVGQSGIEVGVGGKELGRVLLGGAICHGF